MNEAIYATLKRPVLLTVPDCADFYGNPTGHQLKWMHTGASVRIIEKTPHGDYVVSACPDELPPWSCGLVGADDLRWT